MSIMDYQLHMCDAQTLASVIASGIELGNAIDLGAAGVDGWGNALAESPGEGQQVFFNVKVVTTLNANAITVQLLGAAAIGSSSALTSGVELVEVAIPASTPAGAPFSVTVPMNGAYRYLRTSVAGDAAVTGAIETWLSNCPADTCVSMK